MAKYRVVDSEMSPFDIEAEVLRVTDSWSALYDADNNLVAVFNRDKVRGVMKVDNICSVE